MAVIDRVGLGPTRIVERLDNGYKVTVTPPAWSGISGGTSVVLNADQFSRYNTWNSGLALIQEALPDLSPADREILMTGIGPDLWDQEFSDEDEEEPEDQSQGDVLGLDDEKPEF